MHQMPQAPPMHQMPQAPPMHQMPQAPPMHQMPQAPPMPHMQGMPPMAPLPGMPPNAYMADPSMQMVPMHPAYAPMVYPMQMQMHAMQQREADLAKREAEMSQWMSTRQQRRSTYVSQDTRPPGGAPPAASPYEDIFKEQGGNPDKPDELPPSYNLSEQIKKREEISAMRQNER
ncbi:hypothetical protein LPJ53_001623 [Coemansia erecta]|uniref:Uncharacterized protein n=1 Tax=Coemansia erecta TaxID=147472 RepID=A0A9W7Y3X9_9FUNG|nr:hypothetical protein LPJ53_001623 [Coemansia erecta]